MDEVASWLQPRPLVNIGWVIMLDFVCARVGNCGESRQKRKVQEAVRVKDYISLNQGYRMQKRGLKR